MKATFTLLIALVVVQAFGQADTTRFTVLTTERISGKQLIWSDGPGKVSYLYQYDDRGRGPKLRVDLTIDKGQVISRKVTGVDYYKGPVSETFEISNGVAKWKNRIEEGQQNVSSPILYMPMEGAPGEIEWDLRLLLQQHLHELNVLPLGKLKVEHVKNHTARVNGFPEELELYSFVGSGGPPAYFWVTPKKDFFAEIEPWSATIKLGYEFLVPELRKLQETIELDYFTGQAFNLTQKSTKPIAITNVSVFDSKSGKVRTNQTVIIDKGKITEVGKVSKINVPTTYKVIQGNGKMLLPGLWDNHVHYDMEHGIYDLASGVTNVKDLGNSLDLPETKQKLDKDEFLGPDISVMSGCIDFAGPYSAPTGKIVKTMDEGLAAVNYYADHGYQQIKLYSSIPVEWVKPLAAEAHKRGLKVVGHIPSGMTAERAINDGYDQVIHINMVMLNFMGDSLDTRSMGRFTKVGERARNIDLKSPQVKRFVQLLKDKNITVDPTAAIFEDMLTHEDGKVTPGFESVQNTFPPELRRALFKGGLTTMKGHEADYKSSFDNMLMMIKLLHANGVTIVTGTDHFDGFTLHREMELYSKAGIPNGKVLQAATYTSAKVAGMESSLGSIEPGKTANLILVDGDPLKNISDIRKVELTIKKGNIYDSKLLYQSYGFGFWK